jgi:hypothetical protein
MQDSNQLKKGQKYLKSFKTKQNLQFTTPPLIQSSVYKSMFCQKHIDLIEGKTSSRSCKARWCVMCNYARFAIRANHYLPYLAINNLTQFTTLTMVNPYLEGLPQAWKKGKNFISNFFKNHSDQIVQPITDYRDGVLRNKYYNPLKASAILSIECTFELIGKTYHLHFHILHSPLKTWISQGNDKNGKPLGHAPFPKYNKENKQLKFTWYETKQLNNIQVTNRKTMRVYEGTTQQINYQNALTESWLKAFPTATAINQKVKPMTNILDFVEEYANLNPYETNQILDLFKYAAKPYNKKDKGDEKTYYEMYGQYLALAYKKRLFQTYNLNAPPLSEKNEDALIASESEIIDKPNGRYQWNWFALNYTNSNGEELKPLEAGEKQILENYKQNLNLNNHEETDLIEKRLSNDGNPIGYGESIKYLSSKKNQS